MTLGIQVGYRFRSGRRWSMRIYTGPRRDIALWVLSPVGGEQLLHFPLDFAAKRVDLRNCRSDDQEPDFGADDMVRLIYEYVDFSGAGASDIVGGAPSSCVRSLAGSQSGAERSAKNGPKHEYNQPADILMPATTKQRAWSSRRRKTACTAWRRRHNRDRHHLIGHS